MGVNVVAAVVAACLDEAAVERFAERRARLPRVAALLDSAGMATVDALRSMTGSAGLVPAHFLAFRVATWQRLHLLQRLDQLLAVAARCPGWQSELREWRSGEYGMYWSLVWQLQLVEFFVGCGASVEFLKGDAAPAPDMVVRNAVAKLYVEAYVLDGFGSVEEFALHCMRLHDLSATVHRSRNLVGAKPSSERRHEALTALLRPLTEPSQLAAIHRNAKWCGEVLVSRWPTGDAPPEIWITSDGHGEDLDPALRDIGLPGLGEPFDALQVMWNDALGRKSGKNGLDAHRPNLVAVNMISADANRAWIGLESHPIRIPLVTLPRDIDAALWAQAGIDRPLAEAEVRVAAQMTDHPLIACYMGHLGEGANSG